MKQIKRLKKNNEVLRKEAIELIGMTAKKEKRKIVIQIVLNNRCIQAIQSGISEDNFVKQLDNTTAKLKLIESKFDEWKHNTPSQMWGKDPEGTYKRLNKVIILKDQIKFLNYLLY